MVETKHSESFKNSEIENLELLEILSNYDSIGLCQLDSYNLIDRYDRKYIIHKSQLAQLLSDLKCNYSALEIENTKNLAYESEYFDSEGLRCYFDHHNCRSNRFKIRSRKYLATNDNFFEIKAKDNKNKTTKIRIKLEDSLIYSNSDVENALSINVNMEMQELNPKIKVFYNRISLVNKNLPEKLTIDSSLQFVNGKVIPLDNVIVVEVKTLKPYSSSEFVDMMKKYQIRESSISKYCLGMYLCEPSIKYNQFKKTFQDIGKISNGIF